MEFSLSNDRIIAYHRNRQDYVDAPENTLRFAYGDRRYEKMTKDLVTESDILQLKTLEEINLDFRRGDFINLALLSSDLLDALIKHFRNPIDSIRELASRAVIQVCQLKFGRDKVIENAYIHNIAELIDDSVAQIRTNAYDAMNNLAEFRDGAEHILVADKIPALVDKLIEEKVESILCKVLILLKKILEGEDATSKILETEAVTRLTNLLSHTNPEIREMAAKNLASISFLDIGKQKEIELKCVLPLCKRLDDQVSNVREAASMCLASLAQKNEAKNQILEFSYFARIMELLDDDSIQTQLNIVQLIASIAEHHIGRKKAAICLEKLHYLSTDPSREFLAPYIKGTVDVITWVP